MPTAALLIDFGSTYTKLRAIDLERRRILGSGQGPSTVTSDIMVGMKAALADLEKRLGNLPRFKYRLASSSAAGGLRMVTVGLVRELTAEAARPRRAWGRRAAGRHLRQSPDARRRRVYRRACSRHSAACGWHRWRQQ